VLGQRIGLDEIERMVGLAGEVAAVRVAEDRVHVACIQRVEREVRARLAVLCIELHARPSQFEVHVVGSLPSTAAGKVDYQALATEVGPEQPEPAGP
jgi:acyl-coenzyme A synthetase/AMP-(fatty) acid ligase